MRTKANGANGTKKTAPAATNGEAKTTNMAVVKNEEKAIGAAEQKIELRKQVKGLNLEGTIKLVEELHRKKVFRDNLIGTIDRLEKFEIEHREDMDVEDQNRYAGCRLTIMDDERNEFVTKNTKLIEAVAAYMVKLCTEKLGEIEAGITLPA